VRLAAGLPTGPFDWDGAFADNLADEKISDRVLRVRPLARIAGYEGRRDRLLRLLEHVPTVTDAFNTNSHFSLTLVGLFGALAEGAVALGVDG
jgi:hypothetical protein